MNTHYILQLNSLAVAWFQQGYHEDAFHTLTVAFHEVLADNLRAPLDTPNLIPQNYRIHTKSSLDFERRHPCETTASSGGTPPQEAGHSPLRSKHMQWVKIGKPVRTSLEPDGLASSMYSHAVIIWKCQHDHSCDHYYWKYPGVAVLYNLALVHHWRAQHLGISEGLTKALSLYKMTLDAIQRRGNGPGIEHLTLAVLNNLGHIHSHLFHINEARHCFDSLRLLLVRRTGTQSLLFSLEEYEIFILSAMLQGSELVLAPAA